MQITARYMQQYEKRDEAIKNLRRKFLDEYKRVHRNSKRGPPAALDDDLIEELWSFDCPQAVPGDSSRRIESMVVLKEKIAAFKALLEEFEKFKQSSISRAEELGLFMSVDLFELL